MDSRLEFIYGWKLSKEERRKRGVGEEEEAEEEEEAAEEDDERAKEEEEEAAEDEEEEDEVVERKWIQDKQKDWTTVPLTVAENYRLAVATNIIQRPCKIPHIWFIWCIRFL